MRDTRGTLASGRVCVCVCYDVMPWLLGGGVLRPGGLCRTCLRVLHMAVLVLAGEGVDVSNSH